MNMVDACITHNAEGEVIGRICLGLSLFYQDSHTREKREIILRIFDQYISMIGNDKIRWTGTLNGKRWKKLKNGIHSYVTPHEWLLDEDDCSWEISFHGGEKNEDASDIAIEALGEGSWQARDLAYISCRFPLNFFTDNGPTLKKLAEQWSQWLQPDRGYAGLWFADMFRTDTESKKLRFKLAQQFPGLGMNELIEEAIRMYEGIKGVDWLTILSTRWLEKLEGIRTVEKHMAPLPVLKYAGGAILQAGPFPQLGDNERGVELTNYYHVAKIIEPIRFKGVWCLDAGSQAFTLDTTQEWAARFSPSPL